VKFRLDLDINNIVNLYKNNMNINDISRLLRVSPGSIRRRLVKENTPIRNSRESLLLLGFNGEKHSQWKGGRFYQKGYIMVYRPKHPTAMKCGYMLEHRLIWEETNGKLLPDGWVVHHINGIKDDNRIENLLALPTSKHRDILKTIRKRIIELEEENKMLKSQLGKIIVE